jgi:hypothetical protein
MSRNIKTHLTGSINRLPHTANSPTAKAVSGERTAVSEIGALHRNIAQYKITDEHRYQSHGWTQMNNCVSFSRGKYIRVNSWQKFPEGKNVKK